MTIIQDLRYGVRMLASKPSLAVIAVLALALGIGASTAVFSVVNALLINRLPYQNADRLVMVWENNRPRAREHNVVSPANFLDWREQNRVFDGMAGFQFVPANITAIGDPEEVSTGIVSSNFFDVIGASPLIGRTLSAGDGVEGKDDVAILNFGFWQSHFGGDRNVVGKTLVADGRTLTIVGVMPNDFDFYVKENSLARKKPGLWRPVVLTEQMRVRRGRFMMAIGAIKPGLSVDQARNEMDSLASNLEQQYPDFNEGWGVTLVPIRTQFAGEVKPALLILLGAVGFVLLIACANVANLLMARSASRQKEFAIRMALGAGRWRIIRQLLTESMLLGVIGGAIGLLFARWGVDAMLAMSPRGLIAVENVAIDRKVLGFAIGASLLTSLIFGLFPAINASDSKTNDSLKEGGKGTVSSRTYRVLNGFVVAEVALAIVLLVGSGLMIKSLVRLQAIDPGFDPRNVLTAAISLPNSKYSTDQKRIDFFHRLLGRVRTLPGVQSAGMSTAPPFGGMGFATGFTIESRPPVPASDQPVTDVRVVDQDYFKTMGIQLVMGRHFTEGEVMKQSRVVVISEAMARQHFANEDPIRKRITVYMKNQNEPSEIVGVVRDVKSASLDLAPRAMIYWPHAELAMSGLTLVVKTEHDPLALAGAITREVRALDPNQPIAEMRTMNQLVGDSIARSRFAAQLLAIFSIVALVLASVGIYGVISYSVTQRASEIGIRVALGASRRNVLALVLRRGMLLASVGVAIGLVGALGLTQLLSTLLYSVSTTDPTTFLGVGLLIVGVAFAACLVPARRAMKVDPMISLRAE